MRNAKVLLLIAALLSAGTLAAAAPAAKAPTLVGIWYGIGEPDDPDIFYLDSYHADGTFNSEYRKCVRGKLVYQQTQSGKWTYSNGTLVMNADRVDGKPDRFDHSYTIESLTPREFQARFHGPDFLFVETRVPAFEMPACYLGS